MNTLIAKGNWDIAKGRLKQKYASLTDDDLRFVEGREEELLGRLERATGATRGELERFLGESNHKQTRRDGPSGPAAAS